jgi:hypothetical protein
MFSAATSPDKTWKYFIISLKQSSKAVAYQRVRVFHASSLFREKNVRFSIHSKFEPRRGAINPFVNHIGP